MNEAKNHINDLEHKEAKNNQSRQDKEKRIKKIKTYKQPLGQLQEVQHSHNRGIREEKEQEIGNVFQNIMKEKFPNLVKDIDMHVQEAQSPKQDGCKDAHSKTHYN